MPDIFGLPTLGDLADACDESPWLGRILCGLAGTFVGFVLSIIVHYWPFKG